MCISTCFQPTNLKTPLRWLYLFEAIKENEELKVSWDKINLLNLKLVHISILYQ